jgi:hypothetical protein
MGTDCISKDHAGRVRQNNCAEQNSHSGYVMASLELRMRPGKKLCRRIPGEVCGMCSVPYKSGSLSGTNFCTADRTEKLL